MKHVAANRQKGFTIVEVMIATTILSVLLLLASVIMTGIGNLYTKGVNQASVQDATRSITDDVSQSLQLSDGTLIGPLDSPDNQTHSYCINNTRYTFVLGKQIGTDSPHVLWKDTLSGGCPAPSNNFLSQPAPTPNGSELIPSRSRLADFTVAGNGGVYDISVNVVLGDKDLLCSPSANDCNSPGNTTHLISDDLQCKGNIGQQFCARSQLTTTVTQRIKAN